MPTTTGKSLAVLAGIPLIIGVLIIGLPQQASTLEGKGDRLFKTLPKERRRNDRFFSQALELNYSKPGLG
jgi:hypothetical protein